VSTDNLGRQIGAAARWGWRSATLGLWLTLGACGAQELGEPNPPPEWPVENLVAKRPARVAHGASSPAASGAPTAADGAPTTPTTEPPGSPPPAAPADGATPPTEIPADAAPASDLGEVKVEGLPDDAWEVDCPDEPAAPCTLIATIDGAEQRVPVPRKGAQCAVTQGKLGCTEPK
jgi:hypothetical protein